MTALSTNITFAAGVAAASWQDAVRAAGVDLVNARRVGPAYVDAMLQLIEDAGPWCVVAPGVAVPHARPSALVREDGLAIVNLVEPVAFGHPHNDPVHTIIGVAATTQVGHIRHLAALANALDRPGVIEALRCATTLEAAVEALGDLR